MDFVSRFGTIDSASLNPGWKRAIGQAGLSGRTLATTQAVRTWVGSRLSPTCMSLPLGKPLPSIATGSQHPGPSTGNARLPMRVFVPPSYLGRDAPSTQRRPPKMPPSLPPPVPDGTRPRSTTLRQDHPSRRTSCALARAKDDAPRSLCSNGPLGRAVRLVSLELSCPTEHGAVVCATLPRPYVPPKRDGDLYPSTVHMFHPLPIDLTLLTWGFPSSCFPFLPFLSLGH